MLAGRRIVDRPELDVVVVPCLLAFVTEACRLHREVLGVDAGPKQQLAIAVVDLVADLEAELAGLPAEHAKDRPLHLFPAERVDALLREVRRLREDVGDRNAVSRRVFGGAIEGLFGR